MAPIADRDEISLNAVADGFHRAKENAAGAMARPESAPAIPANLRGTAAEIWTAYNIRDWQQE